MKDRHRSVTGMETCSHGYIAVTCPHGCGTADRPGQNDEYYPGRPIIIDGTEMMRGAVRQTLSVEKRRNWAEINQFAGSLRKGASPEEDLLAEVGL